MRKSAAYFEKKFVRLKANGVLTVCYALLFEALLVGYLSFAALFTIERLSLIYVTVQMNLTIFFSVLFLFSLILALLGRFLDLRFDWKMSRKSPWLWIGYFWACVILLLSLNKFPFFIVLIVLLAFFTIGYLFWKILFGEVS